MSCLPNLVVPLTPDFSRGGDAPAPPPLGRTTIVQPGMLQSLTSNRETDVTYALVRGLKEYLEQLQIETPSARKLLFAQVVEVHADYELRAAYPAAAVTPSGDVRYDAAKFTPAVNEVLKDETGRPYARLVLGSSSTAITDIQVEVWATDAEARLELVAMLEDAFLPFDWSSTLRLMLPHYHGIFASYAKRAVAYQDDSQSKARNIHRAVFKLEARCTVVRMFYTPLGDPRFLLDKVGPNNETNVNVVPVASGGGPQGV